MLVFRITNSFHNPSHCDGCGKAASLEHSLNCHKGGSVILRHNEVRDALGHLASMAFSPKAVSTEPLIYIGCPANRGEAKETATATGTSTSGELLATERTQTPSGNWNDRGDVMVRGLWYHQTDCILDVRITDTDAKSQRSADPMKVLA